MKKKIIIIGSLIIVAAIVTFIFTKGPKNIVQLETSIVSKGTIINTITATGTVEPIDQLEVGTQVSGVIQKIYVDFNSKVTKGQLLAELDSLTLKARLLQAKANLASAENELTYQEQNFNRTKKLWENSMVSETDYETALYKYNSSKTQIDMLKSEVDQAKVNLSYTSIYSPIDGVILNRAIEEGQTVAASFNTPTLFTIARDLTKMQVEASVDEADIGQVKVGQNVTFTVDAFPDDIFNGQVTQIRLEPNVTSNVVTYTVIIDAPNPDTKLLPGLTASVNIITKEAKDVLVVSSKALNFVPTQAVADEYMPKPEKDGIPPEGRTGKMGNPREEIENEIESNPPSTIWVKNENQIFPKFVKKGLEDGSLTEIEGDLSEGDTIVISAATVQASESESSQGLSPFMPRPPQRGKRN
ncbi:MAG TPA: efflux RND transporter periplasmic adaptor subunit [Tenuifilaceae bacterium]|nr:efflux RND transporter periplasmic adaptor subunit [Tenuifilaceae bacterium]